MTGNNNKGFKKLITKAERIDDYTYSYSITLTYSYYSYSNANIFLLVESIHIVYHSTI